MNVHVQVLVDEMKLVDTKSNREKIFPEQFPEKVILRVKGRTGDTFSTVWCWVQEKVSWWSSKHVSQRKKIHLCLKVLLAHCGKAHTSLLWRVRKKPVFLQSNKLC